MDDLVIKARLLNCVSKPADEAKKSVEQLAKAGAKAGNASAFDRANASISRMQRLSNGATGGLSKLSNGLRSAGRFAVDLGNKIVSNIGAKATTAMHTAANAASKLGKMLAGGLVAAGAFGLRAYAQIEQQQVAFETLLGSQDKAARLMKQMKSFANVTPFRFGDVADSAKLLLAGGWKQDSIIPTLTKIGDAASAVSVPIDRVLMQLTQMQASKAMNWADMRVLSQTGLPVLDILGKKLGKTGEQIREIMSNPGGGSWLAKQGGIEKLIDGLGERYKGMMGKQSQTLAGLWSTMKDTFSNNLGDAMTPLANGIIKPFLTKLIPQVESKLKGFAKLSQSIVDGWKGTGGSVTGMAGEAPRNGFKKRGGIIGVGMNLDKQFHGGGKFLAVATKIQSVLRWIGKHADVFKSLAIAVGLVAVAFALAAAAAWLPVIAATALVTWLVHLYRHSERFRNIIKTMGVGFAAMGRFAVRAFKWVVDHAKQAGRAISTAFRNVKGFFGAVGRAPKNAGSAIAHGWHAAGGAIRKAWNATRGFREAVGRLPKNAINGIKSAFSSVAGMAKKAFNATRGFRETVGNISQAAVRGIARALASVWNFAKKVWAAIKTVVQWIGKITSGPVDALVGAFSAVTGAIGGAIGAVRDLIGMIGRIPSNIGNIGGSIGSGAKSAAKKVGSFLNPFGDTTAPRVRVRGYQTHGRAPLQRALSIGQGIKVTSGFRTHSLGSFNSAHKAGNGFDLVGSGLNSYASRLNNSGGFAQFHGNGSARHLHTEQPLGDTSAPRVTPGRSQQSAPAEPVIINIHPMAHHSPTDIAQMVKNAMDRRERDIRERSAGTWQRGRR
jgi:tape measure domain-containing protein